MPDEGGLDPDVLLTLGVDASQLPEGVRRAVNQIAPQFKELKAQLESLRLGEIDASQFTASLRGVQEQANRQTAELRKDLSLSSIDLSGIRSSYTALFRTIRTEAKAAGLDISRELRSAQSSINAGLRPTALQQAYPGERFTLGGRDASNSKLPSLSSVETAEERQIRKAENDLAAAMSRRARQAETDAAKVEAEARKSAPAPTAGGAFLSGISGRGYTQQGQGIVGSLAGTTGILSKYALGGIAIGGAVGGLSQGFQEVQQAQNELVTLKGVQQALNEATGNAAHTQIDFNSALADGAKLGLGATDVFAAGTVGIRNYSDEIRDGADASKVFTDSVKAAGVAASITGQQIEVAQQNLLQVSNAFGLKASQQGQVNDAILAASRNFNASPSQILSGIGQAGDLAGVAGFDVNSLSNTVAATISTGAPASGLARLLSKGGDAQFAGGLATLGVSNTGNIAQELTQMADGYSKLNDAQKLAFAQSVGGARSASILIALLTQQQKIVEANAQSYTHAGQAEEQAYKQTQTLGGQIRQFSADLKQLAQEVGNSGAFTPLVVAFGVVKSALEAVNFAFGFFDKIPGIGRKAATSILEVAGAVLFLKKAGGGEGILAGLGNLYSRSIGRIPGAPGGGESKSVAAINANTLAQNRLTAAITGNTLAEEENTAVSKVGGLTGLLNKVPFGKGLTGGGLPGLGGGAALTVGGLAAGAAVGALVDAYTTYKVADKNFAQTDAIDRATNSQIAGNGTSEALLNSAKELSKAAADARHSSAGFLGGAVNLDRSILHDAGLSDYGSTEGAAKQAQRLSEVANALGEDQKKREARASANNGLHGVNFSDATGFSTYAQAQTQQGTSAVKILKDSSEAFNNFLDQSGRSGSYLAKGSADAVAGQYANDFVKNLLDHANSVLTSDPLNKSARAVAGLNKDQATTVAAAAQGAFATFVKANNLTGTDLSAVSQDQRNGLAKDTRQRVREALDKAGIKGVTDEFITQLAGTAAISFKDIANNVNPLSGQKINFQQVQDFITSQQAQAQAAQQRGTNQDTIAGYGGSLPATSKNLEAAQTALAGFQSQLAALKSKTVPNTDAIRAMQDAVDAATISVHQAADAFGQAATKANAAALSVGSSSTGFSGANSFFNTAGATQQTQDGKYNGSIFGKKFTLGGSLGAFLEKITGQTTKTQTPGALDALGKSLGFQSVSQSDLNAAATPGSQLGSAVQAKAIAEQNYYNAVKQKKGQAEIDSTHRAYLDASLSLEQARQQDASTSASASVAIGDAAGEALAQQRALLAQAALTADPGARNALLKQAQQQGINAGLAGLEISSSQALARLSPGDELGTASTQLQNDRDKLAFLRQTTPADLKAIADAQVQINSDLVAIVGAYSTTVQNINNAGIDTTDPAQVARAALNTAQSALIKAKGEGLKGNALLPYSNAVKDAGTSASSAAFQEQQQILQDQLDLHQISNSTFIQSQRHTLAALRSQLATMKVGQQGFKQVQDEITAVSKSILATSAQATGQFNIGNIKIPTPYEVQRSIAASKVGAGYNVMPITNNTSIVINGTDLAAVKAVLSQYLGNPLTTTNTAPRKVH